MARNLRRVTWWVCVTHDHMLFICITGLNRGHYRINCIKFTYSCSVSQGKFISPPGCRIEKGVDVDFTHTLRDVGWLGGSMVQTCFKVSGSCFVGEHRCLNLMQELQEASEGNATMGWWRTWTGWTTFVQLDQFWIICRAQMVCRGRPARNLDDRVRLLMWEENKSWLCVCHQVVWSECFPGRT